MERRRELKLRKSGRRKFSLVGLPSVLLGLAWIGMWSLWPDLDGSPGEVRTMGPPRVTYLRPGSVQAVVYRNPDLFARPSTIGFGFSPNADEDWSAESAGLTWRVPQAAPPRFEMLAPGRPGLVAGAGPETGRDVGFAPEAPATDAFAEQQKGRMHIVVEASPSLDALGFVVPDADSLVTLSDVPWQVECRVEVSEHGTVEHVFIDAGAESAKINRAVVVLLHGARMEKATVSRIGRVTVSRGIH